ncbi:MAG: glycosyltransferase family 4 protein [Acidimicrobiales bacterium]
MSAGRVVLDLVAPQSPSYRERGIARHGLAFAEALVSRHGPLVDQILVHPELPPAGGMAALVASGKVSTSLADGTTGGVFHVTSPFEPEIAARTLWPRAASRRRMQLVATVYDLIPDVFPDMYLQDPGLRRRWRSGRELVRAADHVFALSECGREDIIRLLGVPEERVSVIGAGCDERFRPARDRIAALANARAAVPGLGKRFLVCNGAIDPRKNLTRLVEAFAALEPSARKGLQLVLVCRANALERNHFVVMAERLGTPGAVLLPGYVPDETLVALYQSTELAVFPSLYEGYGLPVVEALACGATVIAGDNSSLREILPPVARFDATDTSAIASAIAGVLTDDHRRQRIQQESHTSRPTWAGVADRAAEVYERLLARTHVIVPGWRSRPRLALVIPSAEPVGVVMHSRRLGAELSRRADIDVFVDDASPARAGANTLAAWPKLDRWVGGYDATLVCLANAVGQAGALAMLGGPHPPIVVAHDVRLTELYRGQAAASGDSSRFRRALEGLYPGLPSGIGEEGGLPRADAERHGILMARGVIGGAAAFLVGSPHEAQRARLEAWPGHAARVGVLPFACPPPETVPARRPPGTVLLMDPDSDPAPALRMLGVIRNRHPDVTLTVTSGSRLDAERWRAQSAALGLADGVELCQGDGSEASLLQLLRDAEVAVSWPTGGIEAPVGYEVAVCLSAGVPVVMADSYPSRQITGGVTRVSLARSDADTASLLANAVAALLEQPEQRNQLGQAGARFAAQHPFAAAATTLLEIVARTTDDNLPVPPATST